MQRACPVHPPLCKQATAAPWLPQVKVDFNATLADGTSVFLQANTFLDPVNDASTIDAIPADMMVRGRPTL